MNSQNLIADLPPHVAYTAELTISLLKLFSTELVSEIFKNLHESIYSIITAFQLMLILNSLVHVFCHFILYCMIYLKYKNFTRVYA